MVVSPEPTVAAATCADHNLCCVRLTARIVYSSCFCLRSLCWGSLQLWPLPFGSKRTPALYAPLTVVAKAYYDGTFCYVVASLTATITFLCSYLWLLLPDFFIDAVGNGHLLLLFSRMCPCLCPLFFIQFHPIPLWFLVLLSLRLTVD